MLEVLNDIKEFTIQSGEYVSELSEDIPIIRMITIGRQIWNYNNERKMKRFLIGLSKKVNQNGEYSNEDKSKIKKFLENNHTREKFFSILDEALSCNSEKCSELLGYFAGEILLSKLDIDFRDTVLIYALRNINDWDLKYFKKAYRFLDSLGDQPRGVNESATLN